MTRIVPRRDEHWERLFGARCESLGMPDWTKNVVVAGSGHAKLDDEVIEIDTWDALRVAPAVIRSFEAGPEGLDVICIGGRKPKGGDTERFEDFWS